MGKMTSICLLISLFLTGCSRSEGTVVLGKDTPLVKRHDALTERDIKENQIAILPSGMRLDVEEESYNKDSMVYKVKTADGKEGWIFFDGYMEFTDSHS